MADVSLRFLGSLRLLIDGAHVTVERAQTRAFLALLARHPGAAIPAARLIELLWGDATPKQPTEALRTVVTRARKALGDDSLLKHLNNSYVLDLPHASIDVHVFREASDRAETVDDLRNALALWNGRPFADCGRVARLLEDADELEDRRWDLSERYLQSLLRARETEAALAFGLPLLDERRHDDRLASLITIGLARAGREREARALVETVRAELLAEDPGADVLLLDRAEERIATELPQRIEFDGVAKRSSKNPLLSHVTNLYGRQGEIDVLREAATDARTEGRVVVIVGEPGVGKTALAASFADKLGWRQWCVRCGAGIGATDGWISQALGSVSGPVADVAAMMAPRFRNDLASLAERGPTVIVLDDVQWALESELLVLRALIRGGLPPDVLIVATARPLDILSPDSSRVFAEILREQRVSTLDLEGLDLEAVKLLARRLQPGISTRQCTKIWELTRGNAFAVRSLCELDGLDLDGPITDLPAALVMVTEQRVSTYDRAVVELLELASLLDPPIDFGALAALSGIDRRELLERLRPAFESKLLVEDLPGEVRFDHELSRHSMRRRVPAALQRTLHDRLAAHFSATDQIVLAGLHLVQALPDTEVDRPVPVLLTAAEAALDSQQFAIAIDCFAGAERLLSGPDTHNVALRRGLALEQSGRRDQATELYDELAEVALAAGEVDILARCALAGLAQGVVGGDDHRLARLRTSARFPPSDQRLELEVVVQLCAELGYASERVPDALVERATELADESPADQALLLALQLQGALHEPVDDSTFERIERLADLAFAGGDVGLMVRAYELQCCAALTAGDLATARRAVVRLDAHVRRHPSPRHRWAAALVRSMIADLEHGMAAAAPVATAALELGRNLELPDAKNAFAIFKLAEATRAGALARLEGLVALAAADRKAVPEWHGVHAATLRAAGRADEVIDRIERFRAGESAGRSQFPALGFAMSILATAGLETEPARQALEWAAGRLRCWSGNLVVVGVGAGCFGPAELYLALAAAPLPQVAETWAGPWLEGSWAGLAEQVSRLSAR